MGPSPRTRSGSSKALAILLALLVIFGPMAVRPLGPVGQAVAQLTKSKVTLTVTPNEAYIDQTSEDGAAMFNGTVTTQALPIVVITVNITVDAGGWTNETSTQTLVITGSKDSKFTVRVYSPYNATANQQQDVTVSIKWTSSMNEKGNAATEVVAIVDQIFGVNIYATKSYPQLLPGTQETINLIITNNGNGEDSFSLKVLDTQTLDGMGCSLTLSKSMLYLDMDGKETVQLTIVISKSATPNIYKVRANAVSEAAKAQGLDIFDDNNITIRIKDPGGGGTGGNDTKDNKTKPWYTCGFIPTLVLIPLGASVIGVRTIQSRKLKLDENIGQNRR